MRFEGAKEMQVNHVGKKKHWKCFEGKLNVPFLLSVARAETDSAGILG